MDSGCEVHRATTADAALVAPLFDAYRQFYGLAPDPALAQRYIAERLERGESVVLIARSGDGAALGFVQLYPTFSSLHAAPVWVLNDLFVASAARRLGVARQLMLAAATTARACGAVALTLQTARTNFAAQQL